MGSWRGGGGDAYSTSATCQTLRVREVGRIRWGGGKLWAYEIMLANLVRHLEFLELLPFDRLLLLLLLLLAGESKLIVRDDLAHLCKIKERSRLRGEKT